MSRSSATETGVAWFCFTSGAVHVSVDCVGSPEPIVVSSSSASSTECASPPDVHWDQDIVHASGGVGGVEVIWVLIVKPFIRVALKVSLKVCERATTKSSRLELRAWNVGRIATLLFQYIVEEFLAPSNLYRTLLQLSEVASLRSFNNIL